MSLIAQNKLPQVAMEFMNDTHREDVDIINDLYKLIEKHSTHPSEEIATAIDMQYESWYEHTLDHFEGEEIKMLELNFPPYSMHKGEHQKALAQMETVYRVWKEDRNISDLKQYIAKEIPMWLHNHIQTMDTITAMFFKQQLPA
ncbi:MAG: hemerythrin family protein [Thiovulaceae bacterium]|nr:hemerythrin family protein [Sulfurimonadaceae bacterium]